MSITRCTTFNISDASAFKLVKPTYADAVAKKARAAVPTKAPAVVPNKAPRTSLRVKKEVNRIAVPEVMIYSTVPTKAPRAIPTKAPAAVPNKAPRTPLRMKNKAKCIAVPEGMIYSTIPKTDTSPVTKDAPTYITKQDCTGIVYKATAFVYEDTQEPTPTMVDVHTKDDAHEILGGGGGNTTKKYFSGKVLKVPLNKDGSALWEPTRLSFIRAIAALVQVIKSLPSTSVNTDTSSFILHPLVNVSSFTLKREEYNAAASMAYPGKKNKAPTQQKQNKALAKLLCYMGLRSTCQRSTGIHVIRFSQEAWNKNGYRLLLDTGGVPTIVYG